MSELTIQLTAQEVKFLADIMAVVSVNPTMPDALATVATVQRILGAFGEAKKLQMKSSPSKKEIKN